MKFKQILVPLLAAAALGSATAHAALVNVTTDVTGNVTWYNTNTYLLQTVVYVKTNAVLSIEPGTVIKGATNTSTLIPKAGIPNLVSALWVCRGGQLYATGTCQNPIIFTFEGDDVNVVDDVATNASGLWGGLVLLGRAQINSAQDAGGQAATPKYEVYEGSTGAGTIPEQVFGGNNDADNSGILRYVSIRYTGSVFAPAKELNGLTMGAVGSGTTIEYVEVMNSSDDAFEWWGGVVNASHLVAAFCEDDDFDTDQGFRGTNQFLFGIKPPWAGSTDSRSLESDGDLSQSGYPGNNATPHTSWAIYNATLIGRGTGATGFGGGWGWNPRDEVRGKVYNSIFTEFAGGILVDSDDATEWCSGFSECRNGVFNVTTFVSAPTSPCNIANLLSDTAHTNSLVDPLLGGVSYARDLGLNPRPQPGSTAFDDVLDGAPVPVAYRGAFDLDDRWADGWTALSQYGILSAIDPATPVLNVTRAVSTAHITFDSQSGTSYLLQTATELETGAWTDTGSVISGTGGTLQLDVPIGSGTEFLRLRAY